MLESLSVQGVGDKGASQNTMYYMGKLCCNEFKINEVCIVSSDSNAALLVTRDNVSPLSETISHNTQEKNNGIGLGEQ